MSRWTELLQSVERAEPSPVIPARALARAAERAVADRPSWRPPRVLVFAMAATGVALVIVLLALAAHSRSSAPEPARLPFPAPPACAIATGGSGVDCGPASAAIRTAGGWQVINQGSCIDHTRLYFGVHTSNGAAPLSLMVNMPPEALANGGDAQVTNGQLAPVSGAKESLSGQAVVEPGGKSGAFTVHGRDAQGRPDGNTYAGAWTCRAGHTPQHVKSQQTPQAELPQCTQKEIRRGADAADSFVSRDGYRLVCGPGSAIVWAAGRWQVVSPGICSDVSVVRFGILNGMHPDGADPHRTLEFFMESEYHPALRNQLVHGGRAGVIDGEIDLLGAHEALSGRAIVQRGGGGGGGAFDLNNRGGPSAGYGRNTYVGAWTCGLPNSLLYKGPP